MSFDTSLEQSILLQIVQQTPCATPGNLNARIENPSIEAARILIVDDEPVNAKTVAKHLRTFGYVNVFTTTDSVQASERIGNQNWDLVLLDVMMPQVSGLAILRQVRSDDRLKYLPVIIFTAYCDPNIKREAMETGATDFLAKPVDPIELAPRVRNALMIKLHQDGLKEHVQQLKDEIRRQSQELYNARHESQLRYLSGKAEIATDVLHNVGNALNSVNVGVSLVGHTLRESKVASLERAAALLQQQGNSLTKFLTKDKRGRVLPSYLVELSATLLQERESVLAEIDLLVKHLRHINAVVATQQKYAALCNVTEELSLAELLSDAEELFGGAFVRHGVKVSRLFEEVPPVKTDRLKLMQVLLNVFKNAVQAIQQSPNSEQGHVEISLKRSGEDHVVIEFRDNGVGISEENKRKIFSHGFTTRNDGHGFGLHSCANLMKELGGSIQAASDGLGKGATFTLQLPLTQG